jgi:hypothetical protein
MAELSCSTGSPDPQHPLNAVLFSDRAGFPHESPADPPAVASPAPAAGTAAVSPVPSPRCAMWVTLDKGKPPELVHVPYKAQHRDRRSVRRVLKRLGRRQRHRTQTFAQTVAKRLVDGAPPQAVLVFERLQVPLPQKEQIRGRAARAPARAVAAGADPTLGRAQGPRARTAGDRGEPSLHQPGLFSLWATGEPASTCLHLSAVRLPGARRHQRRQEYPYTLYCPAGQWAAVEVALKPGPTRLRASPWLEPGVVDWQGHRSSRAATLARSGAAAHCR